jgi:hypothetical protein
VCVNTSVCLNLCQCVSIPTDLLAVGQDAGTGRTHIHWDYVSVCLYLLATRPLSLTRSRTPPYPASRRAPQATMPGLGPLHPI